MTQTGPIVDSLENDETCGGKSMQWKLWIYTNYDCNLRCTYCVAESSPRAERRALSLDTVRQLIDEATELGFEEVFLTGGEPFILDDIYDMLAYASQRMKTTVLTNGMLIYGKRLERLRAIANDNLTIQVSLDGGSPEPHDAYRGAGTWAKTVAGIERLLADSFHVRISSTETPANADHLDELNDFRRSLGIADRDHLIRPLAKRGFSDEGVEVGVATLAPELTVTQKGVYWHPLASPTSCDMLVTPDIFPLAAAVSSLQESLDTILREGASALREFT